MKIMEQKGAMNSLPKSRSADVLIQEVDGELLIYDLKTDKVLCLNPTSATVWQLCDGKTTCEEMSKRIGAPIELVWLAVEEFQKNKLFEHEIALNLPKDRVSRRGLLLKLGAATIALPIVGSIVAPTAAYAQSSCIPPLVAPGGALFGGANCGSPLATCTTACTNDGLVNCCSMSASIVGTCPSCMCFCN
jgi:hypothetical protein